MKKLLIKIIHIYQAIPFNTHACCRFYPTCSTYMMEALEKYGVVKGLYLGIKRILRCNPFNKKTGYDPVP